MTKKSQAFVAAIGVLAVLLVPAAGLAQGVLFVKDNKVGIGDDSPASNLEIQDNSGTPGAKFMLDIRSATGDPKTRYLGVNGIWSLSPQGQAFVMNNQGAAYPGNELRLTATGNLTILGNLTQGSSRTYKENIVPVASQEVLNRVLELPIAEWSYIRVPGERHLGPIAEDFSDVFGLGSDNKGIAPGDMAGVALAAVQGLNERLEAKNAEIAELEARLFALEALVQAGR